MYSELLELLESQRKDCCLGHLVKTKATTIAMESNATLVLSVCNPNTNTGTSLHL